MKTLITGGCGFIGSHLAEALVARGDEVAVIDNLATGRRANLDRIRDKVRIVEGSIEDGALVDKTFGDFGPDTVIHAAAAYKDPHAWVVDTMTNGVGGVNVIQAARAAKVKRFVYFQTALCYGNAPREQPVTLAHPRYPDCSYAISKTTSEQYLEISGLDYVTFRLANIIGPRNLSGPVPAFFKRIKAGQPCTVFRTRRDFVLVDDLVDLVLRALSGKGASGTYHASSGRDYAIQEIYDAVAKAMNHGVKAEVRDPGPDDAPTILLDPTKTFEQFGWKTTTPLEETVRRAVAWYQEHGLDVAYTHLKLEPKRS